VLFTVTYPVFIAVHKLGFTEGQNLVIEHRRMDEGASKAFASATELIHSNVDVVVAFGPELALKAAVAASQTVPIVMSAMDLDKANKAHSDGKLSNVDYSEVLRGLANAAYPNDGKLALGRFIEANKSAFAEKLAADYARSQQAAPGTAEGPDLREAHLAERRRGVRSGIGVGPRVSTSGITGTAANDDGTDVTSPTRGVIASASKADIFRRVHKQLVAEGHTADEAWSAIHRHERRGLVGW
jgi:hypothetical protein